MSSEHKIPRVSIGMPVFNGEEHIKNALDSLLKQTFSDFELIISDNGSSDKTKEICEHYIKNDPRIRYIRQTENIGATKNFKFVLEQAVGKYFMWAAADDIKSKCFVEKNINFLDLHPEYVASTSKNYFEGEEFQPEKHVKFSIEGNLNERLKSFISNCRYSHGIFYSLIRTENLRDCEIIGKRMIAADWVIDVHLLAAGPIRRVDEGYMVSGRRGVSNSSNPYKPFQNHAIEFLLPMYLFSKYFYNVVMKSHELSVIEKFALVGKLVRVNMALEYTRSRKILTAYSERLYLKKR